MSSNLSSSMCFRGCLCFCWYIRFNFTGYIRRLTTPCGARFGLTDFAPNIYRKESLGELNSIEFLFEELLNVIDIEMASQGTPFRWVDAVLGIELNVQWIVDCTARRETNAKRIFTRTGIAIGGSRRNEWRIISWRIGHRRRRKRI
jgi:hypothetical protein